MSVELEANRLLKNSIDEKLCYGGKAESLLREAYEFTKKNELYDPWLRIAAYRLAHCLFRKAKSEKEVTEVLRLFEEAAEDVVGVLKPKAKLYALAANVRLGIISQDEFNQLVKTVSTRFREDVSSQPVNRVIQTEVVNQLELLAYIGGYDYGLLEGLSPRAHSNYPFANNWRVIGTSKFDQHSFAKEHAISIARKFAKQYPDAVVCIWCDHGEVYKCDGPIGSREITATYGEMLIDSLRDGSQGSDNPPKDRQTKKRLNSFIKELCGEPLLPVSGSFEVNPELKCLAVIPESLIH